MDHGPFFVKHMIYAYGLFGCIILFFCFSDDINRTDNQHDQVINLPATATSRWNPTPEQIMTLEELYRSGTRTPTTEQIKEIAFKLRKFGRIEGKNVFYWFQNHKARDRLKRRRCERDANNNVHQPHNDVKYSSGSWLHEEIF